MKKAKMIALEVTEEELTTLVQACSWGFQESGLRKYEKMMVKLRTYYPAETGEKQP